MTGPSLNNVSAILTSSYENFESFREGNWKKSNFRNWEKVHAWILNRIPWSVFAGKYVFFPSAKYIPSPFAIRYSFDLVRNFIPKYCPGAILRSETPVTSRSGEKQGQSWVNCQKQSVKIHTLTFSHFVSVYTDGRNIQCIFSGLKVRRVKPKREFFMLCKTLALLVLRIHVPVSFPGFAKQKARDFLNPPNSSSDFLLEFWRMCITITCNYPSFDGEQSQLYFSASELFYPPCKASKICHVLCNCSSGF